MMTVCTVFKIPLQSNVKNEKKKKPSNFPDLENIPLTCTDTDFLLVLGKNILYEIIQKIGYYFKTKLTTQNFCGILGLLSSI